MALAGPGVTFSGRPREGKIQLKAAYHGLFKVNVDPLIDFNMISEGMCASIHNNTPVEKGSPWPEQGPYHLLSTKTF